MQAPSFEEVGLLNTQILWACFGLTTLLGWVMQRTHFCTMGAVSDIVNMGDWTRMRVWVMAIAVAMIGFQSMSEIGLIDPLASIYASGRVLWLSAVVGGVLFGVGMVLASGCSSKTLLRIGSGSLKSVVVFKTMLLQLCKCNAIICPNFHTYFTEYCSSSFMNLCNYAMFLYILVYLLVAF